MPDLGDLELLGIDNTFLFYQYLITSIKSDNWFQNSSVYVQSQK